MTVRHSRVRPVSQESVRRATLFTNASRGGGIGTVAFINQTEPVFTMDSVGANFPSRFSEHLTYITALELASVVISLGCFKGDLAGAKILCFGDNNGVMYSLRRGTAGPQTSISSLR